jgi:hypothetical protein
MQSERLLLCVQMGEPPSHGMQSERLLLCVQMEPPLQSERLKRKYRALVRPQSKTRLLEPACLLTHYTYNLNTRTPRTFVVDLPTTEKKEGREAEERKQEWEKKKKSDREAPT